MHFSSCDNYPDTGGSAFNINGKSLRRDYFVKEEVQFLLQQHTAETGQKSMPRDLPED